MVDEEVLGTRWVFPEVGRILSIYNWMCFLVADLWIILLNQCQLQFFFFCFLFFVWCHQPRRTIKWPIVCLGFGVYWFSSCIPLNLISTSRLSMWATTSQRAASSTAGWLWTCEKGQGPASLFQMLFLKFLPTLLPTSLTRLVCCGHGEGVFVTLLLFELLR